MLEVFADHMDDAFAPHDFAILAYSFNRCLDLHKYFPFDDRRKTRGGGLIAASAAQPSFFQKSFVIMGLQMRFQLLQSVQRNADDDEDAGASEIE